MLGLLCTITLSVSVNVGAAIFQGFNLLIQVSWCDSVEVSSSVLNISINVLRQFTKRVIHIFCILIFHCRLEICYDISIGILEKITNCNFWEGRFGGGVGECTCVLNWVQCFDPNIQYSFSRWKTINTGKGKSIVGQWPMQMIIIISHSPLLLMEQHDHKRLSLFMISPNFLLFRTFPPLFSLSPLPLISSSPPLSVQLMAGKPAGAGGSQLWERGGGGSSACRCRGKADSGDTGNKETLRDTQKTPKRHLSGWWEGPPPVWENLFLSILDTGTPFNLIWVCKLRRGWGQRSVFFIIFHLLHMFSLLCIFAKRDI